MTLTIALLICPDLRADDLAPVAPFIDESTYAVVAIDLEKADPDVLEKLMISAAEAADLPEFRREQLMLSLKEDAFVEMRRQRDDLLDAGAKRMYAVFSLAYLPDPIGFVVFPLEAGADAAKIPGERFGSVVVLAPPRNLERLNHVRPVARPDLAEALAAGHGAAVVIAFSASPATRQVFDEMLPALPPQLGGGSIRPLTHGMRWLSISIGAAPEPAITLRVAARDDATADALRNMLQSALAAAELQGLPLQPRIEKGMLVVELSGDRLRQALGRPVALLAGAQSRAVSRQSASNLKQIGVALHIYAHDHKGQFPTTLDELMAAPYLHADALTNPRFPDREQGYVYLRPDVPDGKAHDPKAVLAHEGFDTWPERGVWAVFGDGHVELISNEAKFKELTASHRQQPVK